MDAWARLGRQITAARRQRGWTQRQLAYHAGVSAETIGRLERAARTTYDPSTLVGVELALAWEHGSIEATLKGGAPTTAPDDLAAIIAVWRRLSARDRATVRALAEQLAG